MKEHRQRRLPNRNGRAGRPWAVLAAFCALLLAPLLGAPGCLNPRPEEDPSFQVGAAPPGDNSPGDQAVTPATPERETCSDNPLLAGCAAPSPGAPGNNLEPGVADGEESAPPVADAGVPDAGGALAPDSSVGN